MGSLADAGGRDYLRLENLDVDIPPDPEAIERTRAAASCDADNSYLPFIGQQGLRDTAVAHVGRMSGLPYTGERNCVISAGGLSGIRSEERRVGKECVRTGRSRWSAYHKKK